MIGFARSSTYTRELHEEQFRQRKIELGVALEKVFPGTRVDFNRPDLRIQVCPGNDVKLTVAPLFVAGRYRKHSRRITASRWIHHLCHGRGCASCGYTGNLCSPSIEELLGETLLKASAGAEAFFHALGREDTDVRMLGYGRPFVMEIRHPRRRSLSLTEAAKQTNENAADIAEVFSLTHVKRDAIRLLKESAASKTYRAWIRCESPPPADAFKRVAQLSDSVVEQLSPNRVKHRKGERTRRRKHVIHSTWLGPIHDRFVWEVCVQSGTYVKELVSGDNARTHPSLSEVLGVPCMCAALDVIEVNWQPPWETVSD